MTGIVTIANEIFVSISNEMEMAPTIIRKIVPGPRIDEINMSNW